MTKLHLPRAQYLRGSSFLNGLLYTKLESAARASCQENSRFSAILFNVVFTPNNNTASFQISATSTVENYVTFDVRGYANCTALLLIEAAAVISASVMRPWMDKPTNSFNLAIGVVNFLNAIFIFIFTNVIGAPGVVVGVLGVVLFALNSVFACVLLIMVIVSTP
ncbi:putative flavin carrier protein 3 [Metarhizium acridum]|nr:putative flavin carrier protein 3 [Metarhizium acridum]